MADKKQATENIIKQNSTNIANFRTKFGGILTTSKGQYGHYDEKTKTYDYWGNKTSKPWANLSLMDKLKLTDPKPVYQKGQGWVNTNNVPYDIIDMRSQALITAANVNNVKVLPESAKAADKLVAEKHAKAAERRKLKGAEIYGNAYYAQKRRESRARAKQRALEAKKNGGK